MKNNLNLLKRWENFLFHEQSQISVEYENFHARWVAHEESRVCGMKQHERELFIAFLPAMTLNNVARNGKLKGILKRCSNLFYEPS